ncbi:unnamed protein product [Aureobasidium mustum]|uniref:Uncharacterized protein n=1 Tax=Aureobasidium mustum TaxID=2773714 RepID=A0A9N8JHK9_9PEZI|nr:unnamed protein product [Aureobasidium mustum]
MSFTRGSSTLSRSIIRYQPVTRPVSVPVPKHQTPNQSIGQRILHKPKSIFESLKAQSTQQKSSGTGLTFGAAMLIGATMLVTPFKEGSPARVILTSTETLIRQRKTEKAPGMLLNWFKASYVWIIVHLWTLLVAIVTWKLARPK